MTDDHESVVCRIVRRSIEANRCIIALSRAEMAGFDAELQKVLLSDIATATEEIAAAVVLLAELGEPYHVDTSVAQDSSPTAELCASVAEQIESVALDAGFAVHDGFVSCKAPTGEPFLTLTMSGSREEGEYSVQLVADTPAEVADRLVHAFSDVFREPGNIYWRWRPTIYEREGTRGRSLGWTGRMRVVMSREASDRCPEAWRARASALRDWALVDGPEPETKEDVLANAADASVQMQGRDWSHGCGRYGFGR